MRLGEAGAPALPAARVNKANRIERLGVGLGGVGNYPRTGVAAPFGLASPFAKASED
jgi:hypothetical protein